MGPVWSRLALAVHSYAVGQHALVVALFGLVWAGVAKPLILLRFVPFRSTVVNLGPLSHLCRARSFRSDQEWSTPIPWPDLARFGLIRS